jgi:hypothetical protein
MQLMVERYRYGNALAKPPKPPTYDMIRRHSALAGKTAPRRVIVGNRFRVEECPDPVGVHWEWYAVNAKTGRRHICPAACYMPHHSNDLTPDEIDASVVGMLKCLAIEIEAVVQGWR